MRVSGNRFGLLAFMALGAGAVLAQSLSVDRLELHGVKAEPVTWRGERR